MEFKILEIKKNVLEDNDKVANETRKQNKEDNVFLINIMSSPGSGKTTALAKTCLDLKDEINIGILEADIDSDVDAKTIAETGAKVIQLHTGGSCHTDAVMTREALKGIGAADLDLVFLENIGNLVCPASFDVGANKSVLISSVPEGDDKPLKYPPMFKVVDAILVSKMDTAPYFNFSIENFTKYVHDLNPNVKIFPISAKTGEGMDAWYSYLKENVKSM